MTTRYEDAWSRAQTTWYGDEDRFTVNTRPDFAHGDKSDAPPPLMMDAPVLQGGGEIYTDSVWENFEHLPESVLIDETPVSGHGTPADSGHGFGGVTTPGASEGVLGAARGRETGADKRATRTTPTYRFFHESFFGFFTKGFEPPPMAMIPGGDAILRRGINAYPENDGPGRPWSWSVTPGATWRRGDYEGSAVQRDFTPPNRTHGEFKMVEPDIVTIIGDAPPPDKPDTYASPFSSLQRFLPTRRRVSGIRRDPGPWDEDMQARPPEPNYAVSVDGMVVN